MRHLLYDRVRGVKDPCFFDVLRVEERLKERGDLFYGGSSTKRPYHVLRVTGRALLEGGGD